MAYEVAMMKDNTTKSVTEPMCYDDATKVYEFLLESYGHTDARIVIRKAT